MSPFIVRCTCLEMDTRGKSHIQNERKAPQDPYHCLSFTGGGGGGCTELTVHGPFTHSTSVLDDICQQALVLNSCGRRLIMPCVEWLVFFRVFFFLTRCGRPPAWESWLSASLSQYRLLPPPALLGHAWSQVSTLQLCYRHMTSVQAHLRMPYL